MKMTFSLSAFFVLSSLFLSESAIASSEKLGVLFSSFGDVDTAEEVEPFVKTTLRDPDVAPVPAWVRPFMVHFGWELSKEDILAEYAAIGGGTHFRARTQEQANRVAATLRERGYDARGYSGFTMTTPHISKTLAQAQRDGVSRLVIFYQGAQWSRPTSYIVYREATRYLAKHPEWKARITMVRSFSDDERFQQLLVNSVERRLQTDFAGISSHDVCIVLPAHGNPTKLVVDGDPAYDQMMRVFATVRRSFPNHKVFHGFQNHSELPMLTWTQPEIANVMKEVGAAECNNVLINGRTSFTVDSLETLYDHGIGEVSDLHAVAPHKRVVVETMFNAEESFSTLLADLTEDALHGKGDLGELR
jgi:ferrochelatase